MKAVIESAGAVASRVQLGAHTLLFDQPASVPGGQDRGPSPLDVMAVAVAGCAHYFAAAFLLARNVSPEGLRVEVETEKSAEPIPRFSSLQLRITLPSRFPEHYLPALERAVRRCPAYGTLVEPPKVELSFDRQPTASAA